MCNFIRIPIDFTLLIPPLEPHALALPTENLDPIANKFQWLPNVNTILQSTNVCNWWRHQVISTSGQVFGFSSPSQPSSHFLDKKMNPFDMSIDKSKPDCIYYSGKGESSGQATPFQLSGKRSPEGSSDLDISFAKVKSMKVVQDVKLAKKVNNQRANAWKLRKKLKKVSELLGDLQ